MPGFNPADFRAPFKAAVEEIRARIVMFAFTLYASSKVSIASLPAKLDWLIDLLPVTVADWVHTVAADLEALVCTSISDVSAKYLAVKHLLLGVYILAMSLHQVLHANINPVLTSILMASLLAIIVVILMPTIMFLIWVIGIPYTIATAITRCILGLPLWAKVIAIVGTVLVYSQF